jgi:hypothetical protein
MSKELFVKDLIDKKYYIICFKTGSCLLVGKYIGIFYEFDNINDGSKLYLKSGDIKCFNINIGRDSEILIPKMLIPTEKPQKDKFYLIHSIKNDEIGIGKYINIVIRFDNIQKYDENKKIDEKLEMTQFFKNIENLTFQEEDTISTTVDSQRTNFSGSKQKKRKRTKKRKTNKRNKK